MVRHQPRGLGALLTFGAGIGLIASYILTHDKHELALNPNFVPNCNLSAIVSCTNVMKSSQSSAFGFPNPWIGLMAFPVVITIGVLLLARTDVPEWIWGGLQAGVIFGIGFVSWLQFQSLYEINALCPWCMVVWSMTFPIFLYVTLRNLRAWLPGNGVVEFLNNWHALILILWYVAVITAIYLRFYA